MATKDIDVEGTRTVNEGCYGTSADSLVVLTPLGDYAGFKFLEDWGMYLYVSGGEKAFMPMEVVLLLVQTAYPVN